eukprot:Gb_26411 [translate_table: standard]
MAASAHYNNFLDNDALLFSYLPVLNDSDLLLLQSFSPTPPHTTHSSTDLVQSPSQSDEMFSATFSPTTDSSSKGEISSWEKSSSGQSQHLQHSRAKMPICRSSALDGDDVDQSTSGDTSDIRILPINNRKRTIDDEENAQSKEKGTKTSTDGRKRKIIIQVRSEEVLEDGYRWRKYGEKAMKNSSIPRSYYKCSDKKCIVKKRVERKPSESDVLVVTYEGIHNHPCPNPVFYVERHVYVPIPAAIRSK